jgi:cytochrome c biogenesis protein
MANASSVGTLERLRRWFRRDVLRVISDLKLAIALLLVIALFSILGTVIEQGQSLAFYQANYPEHPALFGFLTWKVLLTAGLDHVYRTWWYLSLLILFGASLTACTFNRQIPALKWFTRTQKLYTRPAQFRKFALSAELPGDNLDAIEPLLTQRRYKLVRQGDSLYARKGLVGRVGPIVVHASILLTLLGGIVGALTGFIGQEMIPSGQTFMVKNITDPGPFSQNQIPKDWAVKVNRFWVEYTPGGAIDQFYSDLSVLDNDGSEVKRETIHVNQPMRYRGVTMYQASWSIAAARVRVNNSPVFQLPMTALDTKGQGQLWGTWIPTKPDMSEGVSLVAKDLQGTVLIYDMQGKLVGTVREGSQLELSPTLKLSLIEMVGSTGLQIKADPGVPLVYLGFGAMMIGVVLSYFSHSQLWVLHQGGQLYLGGTTNRAQVAFEREFLALLDQVAAQLTPPSPQGPLDPERDRQLVA